jgi:signal transduction histidine kinase
LIFRKKFARFIQNTETNHLLEIKKFENALETKIIISIASNLHHEIKTPLISLKNALLEYNKLFEITSKAIKNNDIDSLKKIYFGEFIINNCPTCTEKDILYPTCEYYSYFEDNALNEIQKLKEIIKSSMSNIYKNISITKTIKSFKNKSYQITIYDIIQQATLIFNIIQNYKIKINIDEELKKCYLNGLPPDILLNIFINHIKNSIEAKSTTIYIKYIRYYHEIKNQKNFVEIEIIDNGKGIKKENISNIYKLNFSTKHKSKQLRGVGLYLTKNILEYFGGTEWLEYTSSTGTIFRLKIPVSKCDFKEKGENKNEFHDG